MLSVTSLTKSYGPTLALQDVSFSVEGGEVVALLGPSGSGKSTLLALIAGLEAPDAGDIRWDGQSVLAVPAHQRGFGLMFQDYALFPHKDVAANVAFGLKMQGKSAAEQRAAVAEALTLVGLQGFEKRDVNTLSGGEQQRVALARALAPHPRLLMLDEPLGALDRALRERLLAELHGILRTLHQTAIYVTHDQEEAFALADRVVILNAGRVAQSGPPAQVYAQPASRFVAGFLGLRNLLPAVIVRLGGQPTALTPAGRLPVAQAGGLPDGARVTVLVRPEAVRLAEPDDLGALAGQLVDQSFRGSRTVARLRLGEAELAVEFPPGQRLPATGEAVHVTVQAEGVQLLKDEG
jgi:ABC-type Fe3+/spermidine/putrescine transport system ATPase subunit